MTDPRWRAHPLPGMSAHGIVAVSIAATAIISLAACSGQPDASEPSTAAQGTTGSGATGTTVQVNGAIDVIDARIPGLGSLASQEREVTLVSLRPGDRLLFYTDGITEARDKRGTFYSLERSATLLGQPDLGCALDGLIDDVLRHVGHALQDDATLLLIGPTERLPAASRVARASRHQPVTTPTAVARQLASTAGSRSRAGTVRSGCAPIVSNGTAERFTQAVRIPAALAPTLSNALLVTRRT